MTAHRPDREAMTALVWGALDHDEHDRQSRHADICVGCAELRAALVVERAALADALGPVLDEAVGGSPDCQEDAMPAPAPTSVPDSPTTHVSDDGPPAPVEIARPTRPGNTLGGLVAGIAIGAGVIALLFLIDDGRFESGFDRLAARDAALEAHLERVRAELAELGRDGASTDAPVTRVTPAGADAGGSGAHSDGPAIDGPASDVATTDTTGGDRVVPAVARATDRASLPELVEADPDRTILGKVAARTAGGRQSGELILSAVAVEASIRAGLASTAIDHLFRSELGEIAEGLYEVTVPAGASVQRYALADEAERWLEGKFVERERARQIYESYLPQKRDPGLVEWQDGERFTARVFPVPANGEKRVLLAYTEPALARRIDARPFVRYALPLGAALQGVDRFDATIRIEAPGEGTTGVFIREHPGTAWLERAGDEVIVRITGAAPSARRIVIDVATAPTASRLLVAPPRYGESAGYALLLLDPRSVLSDRAIQPPAGVDLVFVVDRSGSMKEDGRLEDATGQLAEAIDALGPDDRFAVVAFSSTAELTTDGWIAGAATTGASHAARLTELGADGGTEFDAAFATTQALLAGRDDRGVPTAVVLITDGDGFSRIATKPGAPVFAVPIGTTDRHALDLEARTQGGRALGSAIEAVAAAPNRALARIAPSIGVTDLPIHPREAEVFDVDRELMIAWRFEGGLALPGQLTLSIAEAGGHGRSIVIDAPEPERVATEHAARIWARQRIVDLLRAPRENADELADLGVRFRFVTPFTSLLVLESEEEWRRWGLAEEVITAEATKQVDGEAGRLLNRGRASVAAGDLDEAIAAFDQALALAPDEARIWTARAALRGERGDLSAAIQDLDRAIELAPGEADAWVRRAQARHQLGDLEGALEDARRAAALAPPTGSDTPSFAIELETTVTKATGAVRIPVLGTNPALGRLFGEESGRDDAERLIAANRRSAIATHESIIQDAKIPRARPLDREELDIVRASRVRGVRANDLDVKVHDLESARRQIARLKHIKNGLEHDLEDSRKAMSTTAKTLRDKELMISMLRDKGVDIESLVIGAPPPKIDGEVIAVRAIAEDPGRPLVLLNVGKNDRVEKGHQFSIVRDGEFVGKVIVEKVMPDMAGCRVQFFKDGFEPQVPDEPTAAIELTMRGLERLQTRRIDEAIADFTAALALEDGLPTAWLGRGQAHAHRGDAEAARADYERFLALRPTGRRARDVILRLQAAAVVRDPGLAVQILRFDGEPAAEILEALLRESFGAFVIRPGDRASTRP